MTTMLQLIQKATGEMGLSVPTYVAGNTAADTVQQLALLNGLGDELQQGFDWEQIKTEYRFTTSYTTTTGTTTSGSAVITGIPSTTGLDATYSILGTGVNTDSYVSSVDSSTQVTMTQAARASGTVTLYFCKTKYSMASDFDRMVGRTQWDKSKRWEMQGPETSQKWQWLKSGYISTGPRMRFRRLGGYFQTFPPVASSEYIGFEYIGKNWALDVSSTAKSGFTVDTDTCIYPDRLMVVGLKLKYFTIKGFDIQSLTREYESLLDIAKATDTGAGTLSFAPNQTNVLIGYENIPDSGYGS